MAVTAVICSYLTSMGVHVIANACFPLSTGSAMHDFCDVHFSAHFSHNTQYSTSTCSTMQHPPQACPWHSPLEALGAIRAHFAPRGAMGALALMVLKEPLVCARSRNPWLLEYFVPMAIPQ